MKFGEIIYRAFDIFGAVMGLLVFAPFIPFIILGIKLSSPGPIFVRLPSVSGGRLIYVYKFRSMIPGAHSQKWQYAHLNERADGPFFKIKNDPRLTAFGRRLRRFRLDELPQLWNVIRGEMSLVGPRPHEPEEVMLYPDEYRHLIFARAGATGLSQVSGASALPFLKELELDGHYVKNRSLVLDLKIIARTVVILFTDHNAV